MPKRTIIPKPMLDFIRPSMLTEARETRCATMRIMKFFAKVLNYFLLLSLIDLEK